MHNINNTQFHSRVDKWARHPRRIKVKSEVYKILHRIFRHTNNELSNYFKVKHLINTNKSDIIQFKKEFKEEYIGAAFNLPEPSILLSRKVENLALKWFHSISEKLHKRTQFNSPHSIPIKLHIEALCAGISLDVAKRCLIDKEPLTSIISSLESGGSLEALAAHSVYRFLHQISIDPPSKNLSILLEELAELQKFPEVPEAFRFDIELLRTVLSNLKNLDLQDPLLKIKTRLAVESDPEKQKVLIFTAHLIQIDQALRSGKNVNRSEGQYQIEGKSLEGDFAINQFILSLFYINRFRSETTLRLTSEQMGIHFVHLRDKLGSSLFLKTDQEYLQNLDRLEDGCYMIQFNLSGAGHILTLIRENGKDTIIDPNYGSFQSTQSARTKSQLAYLIQRYPLPCSSDSEFANHRIEILKYEKI